MLTSRSLTLLLMVLGFAFAKAQEVKTAVNKENEETIIAADSVEVSTADYEPLKPAKVAFYAAVLPGLGQAANGDYWKIPLVYGALGTGVGIAIFNQKSFVKYRTAYKDRIAGRIDEFTIVNDDGTTTEIFTEAALLRAQTQFRRQKELSILITAGIYVLQIVEANVSAHLSQYNVDDKLSFRPYIDQNDYDFRLNYGFGLSYSF